MDTLMLCIPLPPLALLVGVLLGLLERKIAPLVTGVTEIGAKNGNSEKDTR